MTDFREASSLTDPVPTEGLPGHSFSFSGLIKWYNVQKGFGFIVNDAGGPEIMLHAEILKAAGFVQLAPWQKVAGTAYIRPNGMLRVGKLEIVGPQLEETRSILSIDLPEAELIRDVPVRVKSINPENWSGFLIIDRDHPAPAQAADYPVGDIFFPAAVLVSARLREAKPGDGLLADIWIKSGKGNGLKAMVLRRRNREPQQGPHTPVFTGGNGNALQGVAPTYGGGRK